MTENDCATGPAGPADDEAATWPPHFPHSEIDRLIDDLQDASLADAKDAARMLQLIAKEAQRLRTAVVRLSVARLSAAEREAHQIVSEAQARVDVVRRSSLDVLNNRLDEADHLIVAMRRAFLAEGRAALEHDARTDFAVDDEDET